MTAKELVKELGITIKSVEVDENPSPAMGNSDWPGAHHYMVSLKLEGQSLSTFYSMGSALTGGPTAPDVLWSLIQDARGIEDAAGFENWADEYGYDVDSRKAEATYRLSSAQTAKLVKFLGESYRDALEIEE